MVPTNPEAEGEHDEKQGRSEADNEQHRNCQQKEVPVVDVIIAAYNEAVDATRDERNGRIVNGAP